MRHLDLFSGIGGFALAARNTFAHAYENVGHSEVDGYACRVYHQQFESNCLGDISKIDWGNYAGKGDLITGGFPCQPHSFAGRRAASGDRRDLWGECVRALRGVRPRFAVFENVPGLLSSEEGRFFERFLRDIFESGYDAEWQIISAADVGAPHLRKRVWLTAHPPTNTNHSDGGSKQECKCEERSQEFAGGSADRVESWGNMAHAQCLGQSTKSHSKRHCPKASIGETDFIGSGSEVPSPGASSFWESEPGVGRVANGVSRRVDRLKGLGNAIVPQCAEIVLRQIETGLLQQAGEK